MFRRKPRPKVQPEWAIVGLGNPGGEYDGTRHNVGFDVVRTMSERHKIRLSIRRFNAVYGTGMVGSTPVLLARPMTYMNLSGRAAAALLRHAGLPPERLVVVFDDMDLAVGRVRVKPKGGAGSHNGLGSVIESVGSKDFPRVRIGIGAPAVKGVDHVLSRFNRDELPTILEAIGRAADACEAIVGEGVSAAMNRTNPQGDKT